MSKQSAKSSESRSEERVGRDVERSERKPERDPLSPFGHTMIELFQGPFEGIRFPDLDAEVLESSRNELIQAQLRLELTEKQLELARANVRDASTSFTQCAGRALAYMRVYAMGQAQLEEVLATASALTNPLAGAPIARDGDAKPEEKKKRGRPRKIDTAALLPMGAVPMGAVPMGAVPTGAATMSAAEAMGADEAMGEGAEETADEMGEELAEEVSVVAA